MFRSVLMAAPGLGRAALLYTTTTQLTAGTLPDHLIQPCAYGKTRLTRSGLGRFAGFRVDALYAPGRWWFRHEIMRFLRLYFVPLITHDPNPTTRNFYIL